MHLTVNLHYANMLLPEKLKATLLYTKSFSFALNEMRRVFNSRNKNYFKLRTKYLLKTKGLQNFKLTYWARD